MASSSNFQRDPAKLTSSAQSAVLGEGGGGGYGNMGVGKAVKPAPSLFRPGGSYGPTSGNSGVAGGGISKLLGSIGGGGSGSGYAGGGGGSGVGAGGATVTTGGVGTSPVAVTAETEANPMEKDAYGRAAKFESGVAAGTNEEITRELSRARDDISTGMQREGEAAMGRGADPTFFRSRALASGARDLSNLQGRLADAALGRHQDAISGVTSAAGQAASGQRALHLGTMSNNLEQQRLQLSEAETRARLQEAPYDRLMKMMSIFASNPGAFGTSSRAGSVFGY